MRLSLALVVIVLHAAACGGEQEVAGAGATSVELAERNESGVSGRAAYEPADDGGVRVTVEVEGERVRPGEVPEGEPYPAGPGVTDEQLVAQVRRGSCDEPGEPVESLGYLTGATTTDTVPPEDLVDGGPYAIIVSASSAERRDGALPRELAAADLLACGEVESLP